MAPTVTLWDAAELITAAHGLGIPHPPGTPLFVLAAHVWGDLLRIGDYAWRINLFSALVSAVGAAALFLCVHRVLAGESNAVRRGGAAAAALLAAFAFTPWQNATEAEVYGLATAMIAAVCWLVLRWRDTRGTPRAAQHLLAVVYLLALSVGNHLLGLLVGPAAILFMWTALRRHPASDAAERREEWVLLATVAVVWVALVAVGLGQAPLVAVAAVLLAVVMLASIALGVPSFPLAALVVAAIGVSTYAYLYIRSGLNPGLDMADPETWRALLGVIRREQYPPRSPFDNPLFASGRDNPGRTLALMGQQLLNYVQYCDWQWGNALPRWGRVATTAVFATLGIAGFRTLWRHDRAAGWLFGVLWLVTGLGLVGYMNFKPGYSLFWDRYPSMAQHEVRERDYFFTASFQAWGLFAGIGLANLVRELRPRGRWAPVILGLAAVPLVANAATATRRGADRWLARDFAYDLLQSVGPYGVLFVFGDNDTYPLWYAQAVEGLRRDVSVVNLSLANTEWYPPQLARAPAPFDPAQAPWYADQAPAAAPGPLLDLPAAALRTIAPRALDRDYTFTAGHITLPFRAGTVLWPRDQVVLLILQAHLGRRPIAYAISSGRGAWLGLDQALVQRGLVHEVATRPPGAGLVRGLQDLWLDTAATRFLADSVYRYGALDTAGPARLEPAARQIATTFSTPLLELAQQRVAARDADGALDYLRRAHRIAPAQAIASAIAEIEGRRAAADTGPRP